VVDHSRQFRAQVPRSSDSSATAEAYALAGTVDSAPDGFGGRDRHTVHVSAPAAVPRPFTVLFVCTGNICRSALALRLGEAYLSERLGEEAAAIRLISAGTHAVVGSAMHPDSELVLQGLGAASGNFRARQLHERIAAEADLTLTMTRTHRREVLELAPRALSRTFTLREAADLLRLLGDAVEVGGADTDERLRALVHEMGAARGRRESRLDDDIRDPIGQPVDVHQEVGEAIAEALVPVLGRLAALVTPGPLGSV
jgi:protein-tyrosine-phosphatase